MLENIVQRVRKAHVDRVIVATTDTATDDPTYRLTQRLEVECFRGSENDVLDRYYQSARACHSDIVVRVTADCPFVDPEIIDACVERLLATDADYVSNVVNGAYPDGLDVEAFTFAALEDAWRNAQLRSDREHVTSYILSSDKFRKVDIGPAPDYVDKSWSLSVDEPSDLEAARAIYKLLPPGNFSARALADVLCDFPELSGASRTSVRNFGYFRSLKDNPMLAARNYELENSNELRQRAEGLIPGCSQTFSKGPSQFVQGVAPVFVERAEGAWLWDVDGNRFLDFGMALGPVILGYGIPEVNAAIVDQLSRGGSYTLPHRLEVDAAELIREVIPSAELVRFGKNGSDATAGAVRLARAITGRDVIASCGYHGWQDWYIGTTTRNAGVPEAVRNLTKTFEYNDLESLSRIFDESPGRVAAVIMEPVGVVEPQPGFLLAVKDLAHRNSALLIFDEVVTGFRIGLSGAQGHFGVDPDISCFGKAMANGIPISAITASQKFLKEFSEIFYSFTFGGDSIALAATISTIKYMQTNPVFENIWTHGRTIMDGFNTLATEFGLEAHMRCYGYPPRSVISFVDEGNEESLALYSLFQQECIRRGLLFTGGHNVSYSHGTEEIEFSLMVYRSAMEIIANAIDTDTVEKSLLGPTVQPVFRRA